MNNLELYKPIAEAIAALLFPHGEVVLHDLKSGCIFAIYNSYSKRKAGDASLLEEKCPDGDVFPPYIKITWDGRKIKSTTAVLKNVKGKPIGLLCINLDISKWEEIHGFIQGFINCSAELPTYLFKNDWREKINLYVSSYLKQYALRIETLSKEEKRKLILELKQEGAFETKHAASYIAEVLQISRASVYNYLKESNGHSSI